MRKIVSALFFIASTICAEQAFAWGGWAHKFITYTADKHLEADVRAKVEHYLGSPMVNHATWMDEIRRPIRRKNHPDHAKAQAWRPKNLGGAGNAFSLSFSAHFKQNTKIKLR